jgi:hypothetical protein
MYSLGPVAEKMLKGFLPSGAELIWREMDLEMSFTICIMPLFWFTEGRENLDFGHVDAVFIIFAIWGASNMNGDKFHYLLVCSYFDLQRGEKRGRFLANEDCDLWSVRKRKELWPCNLQAGIILCIRPFSMVQQSIRVKVII